MAGVAVSPSDPAQSSKTARAGWLVLGAIAGAAVVQVADHDSPWVLRVGEQILRDGKLPELDPFSYTAGHAWLNHEWLAEVVWAVAYRLGGMLGVGLLQALCVAATVGLVALALPARSRFSGLAPLAHAVLGLYLRDAASPRAQLLSNVCLAGVLALLARDLRRPSRALWLAAPIQLVWTQLHGGNPTGVALLGLGVLASPSRRRTLVVGVAAALTCAGPYGIHVHDHFLDAQATLPLLREWQPLLGALAAGAGGPIAFVCVLSAALIALVVRARAGERIRFEALALACFGLLAVRWLRFSTECMLMATVVIAPGLARARLPWMAGRMLPALAASFVLVLGVLGPGRRAGGGFDAAFYPVEATRKLRARAPSGHLFNSYNFGGWVMWAWEGKPVFIDGRAFTVYTPAHLEGLLAVYADPPRFRDLDARWGFGSALVQARGKSAGLARWLAEQPDWELVHRDALAVALVKRSR